jgi:hypothetical protein
LAEAKDFWNDMGKASLQHPKNRLEVNPSADPYGSSDWTLKCYKLEINRMYSSCEPIQNQIRVSPSRTAIAWQPELIRTE